MWVFDGEQWTQDESDGQRKETAVIESMRIDEFVAELQVIEIVKPQRGQVPPPPL